MKIYLAAPLFSPMEQRRNRELRDLIAPYAQVFLPQEDGDLLVDLLASGVPLGLAKRKIFQSDLRAIRECDILLLVLDGRTVDEGACVELGYAHAQGKSCIGLKTDIRTLLPHGDNPMIECALQRIFFNDNELHRWMAETSSSVQLDDLFKNKL